MSSDNINKKIHVIKKWCNKHGFHIPCKELYETNKEYLYRITEYYNKCYTQHEDINAILYSKHLLEIFINKGIKGFGRFEALYIVLHCNYSIDKNWGQLNFYDLCKILSNNKKLSIDNIKKLFDFSMLENPTINDLNLLY